MSMHVVLNTLSEYTYFCISKKLTSYTFLFVFKIVKSFQCILKLCKEVEKLHRWACLEAAVCSVLQKRYSLKLCKIHGKAHKWQVSESKRLLFIQKRLWCKYFPGRFLVFYQSFNSTRKSNYFSFV